MFSVVTACCVETVCSVFWLLCSANRKAGCVAADGVEDVAHTWTDIEVRVIRSSPLLMTPTSANTQCSQPGLVGESGSTRTRSSYVLWQGTLPRPFSQLRGVLLGWKAVPGLSLEVSICILINSCISPRGRVFLAGPPREIVASCGPEPACLPGSSSDPCSGSRVAFWSWRCVASKEEGNNDHHQC